MPLIVPISELRNNLSYYAHLARYKGKHIRVHKNKTALFDIVPPNAAASKSSDYTRIFDSYVGVWKDRSSRSILHTVMDLRRKSARDLAKSITRDGQYG